MTTGFRSSGGLLHDTIKFMCARVAEEYDYSVEFEPGAFKDLEKHPCQPDLVLTLHKGTDKFEPMIYVEVQTHITKKWLDKMKDNYGSNKLLIIPTQKAPHSSYDMESTLEELEDWVEDHFLAIARRSSKQKKKEKEYHNCEYCNVRVINIRQHEWRCKRNPKNRIVD